MASRHCAAFIGTRTIYGHRVAIQHLEVADRERNVGRGATQEEGQRHRDFHPARCSVRMPKRAPFLNANPAAAESARSRVRRQEFRFRHHPE